MCRPFGPSRLWTSSRPRLYGRGYFITALRASSKSQLRGRQSGKSRIDVTGLLCARLVQLGELALDSSIANYLLEFDRPDKNLITIRQLLTHTSGLPAWRPLYITAQGIQDGAIAAIANQPLAYEPGAQVLYSDLGFIVLGFLLNRLTGMTLDHLAQHQVFNELHLQRTFFNPVQAIRSGIAACESGNRYERDMCELDPELSSYS